MSFLDLAYKRHSVRSFKEYKILEEHLEHVFKAAQLAPTAANRQPQRFYLIENSQLAKLSEVTRYSFGAPLVICIGYDKTASWKNKYDGIDGGDVDCSIVATHMMLAASEVNLGTCWVGSFDKAKLKELYPLPVDFEPVLLLPIGYPADDSRPHPLHDKRDDWKSKIV